MKVSELIGDNIRSLRLVAGLTQAELAAAMKTLGFRWIRQTVAETEAGRRDATIEELVAIAAYFEMPLHAIIAAPQDRGSLELFAPHVFGLPNTVEVGRRALPFVVWFDLVSQTSIDDEQSERLRARSALEPPPPWVQRSIDTLIGRVRRPWARLWRKEGGHPGGAFTKARNDRLRHRTALPGPIFVWEGEGDLAIGTTMKPWATGLTIQLKNGVPYTARDESESERLHETTQTHPELRAISRQEAYRLRRKRKGS